MSLDKFLTPKYRELDLTDYEKKNLALISDLQVENYINQKSTINHQPKHINCRSEVISFSTFTNYSYNNISSYSSNNYGDQIGSFCEGVIGHEHARQ